MEVKWDRCVHDVCGREWGIVQVCRWTFLADVGPQTVHSGQGHGCQPQQTYLARE
jgi:hypothetical protein